MIFLSVLIIVSLVCVIAKLPKSPSTDECITANDPSFNLPDVSDEFLRGCRKAFE